MKDLLAIALLALLSTATLAEERTPRPGDMVSDNDTHVPADTAAPANGVTAKLKPPDFIVLLILLNRTNTMNFATQGRGHEYLREEIGFSEEGSRALVRYARAAAKLDDGNCNSLKTGLCPLRDDITSGDELLRAAQAFETECRALHLAYVEGAYKVLGESDAAVLRAFLAARASPMSSYPPPDWPKSLAGVDSQKFLDDICDRDDDRRCAKTLDRNYELQPGRCRSVKR